MKRHQQRLAKQQADNVVQDHINEQWQEQCRKVDISIIYTLHTVFGFGKERCERFYKALVENHFRMADNWQCEGDDSHYWIMQKRLYDAGIDIKAFQQWADEWEKTQN